MIRAINGHSFTESLQECRFKIPLNERISEKMGCIVHVTCSKVVLNIAEKGLVPGGTNRSRKHRNKRDITCLAPYAWFDQRLLNGTPPGSCSIFIDEVALKHLPNGQPRIWLTVNGILETSCTIFPGYITKIVEHGSRDENMVVHNRELQAMRIQIMQGGNQALAHDYCGNMTWVLGCKFTHIAFHTLPQVRNQDLWWMATLSGMLCLVKFCTARFGPFRHAGPLPCGGAGRNGQGGR